MTERLSNHLVEVVHLSSKTGEGIEQLVSTVTRRLDERSGLVDVFTQPGDGRTVAFVRSMGALLEEEVEDDGRMRLRVRLSPGALGVLKREVGEGARIETVGV
ncbi:MAG: hypothetical protein AAGG01_12880 [Planctomycetota bacterium]